MADSEAVRSRRKRLHAQGDHSMCRRCPAVRERGGYSAGARVVSELPPPPSSVSVEAAGALDPVAEMRLLAAELHEAYRADTSNAMLARELRATLKELMPKDAGSADADLTGLFAALQA